MRRIKRTVGNIPLSLVFGGTAVAAVAGGYFYVRNEKPIMWRRLVRLATNDQPTPLEGDEQKFLLSWGCCSIKGKQEQMEDFFTIASNPTTALFAIFDGHSGSVSSSFASTNLKQIFAKKLSQVDPDYGKLISDSITETHNELLRTNPNKNPSDGSSVLACVVAKNIVTCANLGDSKAVLSRGYSAFDLSSSHQPNRPDELARITAAGGRVVKSDLHRVHDSTGRGGATTTRSIGDEFYKTPRQPKDLLPVLPEVTTNRLCKEDDFIILGSSGVWNTVSSEDAVEYIHLLRYCNPNLNAAQLSQALAYRASELGSRDNITAMVVLIDHLHKQSTQISEPTLEK